MRKIWSVADARAKFATILSSAREGEPQLIRQSGVEDVEVVKARSPLNIDYVLSGRSGYDALHLVLEQYREKRDGDTRGIETTFWMPPNLSGDVLRWIVAEHGTVQATWYVIDTVRITREAQELLDLPQTTAARIVRGLRLTAGSPDPFTPEVFDTIEAFAKEIWGRQEAIAVLGDDWPRAVAGLPPQEK